MLTSILLNRALRVVGDTGLTTQALEWLENVLYELESVGNWRFLETSATQVTSNAVDNYALPATYSKGLFVTSDEPRVLIQVPKHVFEEMKQSAETGNPKFFAIWDNKVYLYPKPVTGALPTLTLWFFEKITIPTSGQDFNTITGIPAKWNKYAMDGVISEGFAYTDDTRQDQARGKFEQDILVMVRENEEFFRFREAQVDRSSTQVRPEVHQ